MIEVRQRAGVVEVEDRRRLVEGLVKVGDGRYKRAVTCWDDGAIEMCRGEMKLTGWR